MTVYFPTDKISQYRLEGGCYKSCYSLLRTVADLTGISLAFFSNIGEQFSPPGNSNPLCKMIYEKHESSDIFNECVSLHAGLFEKAALTGEIAVGECRLGLKSFVLPVKSPRNDILFYVAGGHFLTHHRQTISEETLADLGITREESEDLYEKSPFLDEKSFKAVISKLSEISEIYSEEIKEEERDERVSHVVNVISDVALQMRGEFSLQELSLSIVDKVSAAFEVDKCALALFDESREFIEIFASNNEFADEVFEGRIEPGERATGIILQTGETFYSYDAQSDPRLEPESIKEWEIKSLLTTPLKVGGETIGLMHFVTQNEHRLYTKKEIEFAEALASEISLVVQTARLFSESQKKAIEITKSRDEIKSYFTKIGAAIASSLNLKQLLRLIVEMSVQVTHSDAGSIYLIENKRLARYVAVSFDEEEKGQETQKQFSSSTNSHFLEDEFGPGGIKSYLGIPLESKGEIKGLLNIVCRDKKEFTPEEVELLSIFAGHAALAIDNARLFATEQKKAREATSLYEAAKTVGESMNLEEVLNRSVDQLTEVVEVDRCLIMLLDLKKLELYTAAERGLSEEQKEFFSFYRIPIDEITDELWESLIQGKPVTFAEASSNCPALERFFKVFPTSSCLLVPLFSKEQLIGIIYLDDSRIAHAFKETQVRLVMTLAIQIASAIQRATLVEQMENNLDQLKALHQVSTAVTGTLSLSRVFDLVVDKASHLIDAPATSMLAWDDAAKEYKLQASRGLSGGLEDPKFHRMISEKTARRRRYMTYYISADIEGENPLIHKTLSSASMGGYVSVPLIARKRVVGVLNCFCRENDKFDSQEIRLLRSFANQAAIAVENARLYAIIKNKVRELATVFEVGKSITSTLDLDRVLDEIATSVVKVMQGDAASIMLLDEEKQELVVTQTLGLSKFHEGEYIKVGSGAAGIAAKIGRPMILHDEETGESPYKFPQSVKQDNMKTILSVPLRVRDKVIGLINLYKKQIYNFTPNEINLLTTLANQAAIAIENARLYFEQYNVAQIIRRNLMPAKEMIFDKMDVGSIYIPSEILSGDYFEIINLGRNRYGLAISDVSGKGTGAAIYNARAKYILKSYAIADYSPSDILTLLNHLMEEETAEDKFISLLYVDLDVDAMEMIFSSAGHEPLILWDNSEKEAKVFEESNLPIGVFSDTAYNERLVEVGKGDILLLYTDGITESRSREGDFFGVDKLIQIVKENFHLSAQALSNKIYTSVQKFTRRKITDDFSLLVIKI